MLSLTLDGSLGQKLPMIKNILVKQAQTDPNHQQAKEAIMLMKRNKMLIRNLTVREKFVINSVSTVYTIVYCVLFHRNKSEQNRKAKKRTQKKRCYIFTLSCGFFNLRKYFSSCKQKNVYLDHTHISHKECLTHVHYKLTPSHIS